MKGFNLTKSLIYSNFKRWNSLSMPSLTHRRMAYGFKLDINAPVPSEFRVRYDGRLRSELKTKKVTFIERNLIKTTKGVRQQNIPHHTTLEQLYLYGIPFMKNHHIPYCGRSGFRSHVSESKYIPSCIFFSRFISDSLSQSKLKGINTSSFGDAKALTISDVGSTYNHEYLHQALVELSKNRETWSPGTDSIIGLLRKSRDLSQPVISCEKMLEIVGMSGSSIIKLPKIARLNTSVDNVRVNPQSNPGLMTSKFFGNKRKYSIHYTREVANLLMHLLQDNLLGYYHTWECIGREKDVNIGKLKVNDHVLTRLCMHMEEPYMLVLSSILQPINDLIVRDVTNNIFLGKELTGSPGDFFYRGSFDHFEYAVEMDWENFDIHVTIEEMLAAICLLRECYPPRYDPLTKVELPNGKLADHCFVLLAHAICYKRVILENGHTFKFHDILPSGFPGTSLIGSLINLIRWCVIGYYLYGKYYQRYMKPIVHGDDSLVLVRALDQPQCGIRKTCLTYLGQCVEDINVYPWSRTVKYDLIPTFLKRKSLLGLMLVWDSAKVLRKLSYPNKIRRSFIEYADVLLNYVYSCRGEWSFNVFLMEFLRYLYVNVFESNVDKKALHELELKYSGGARIKDFHISSGVGQTVHIQRLLKSQRRLDKGLSAISLGNLKDTLILANLYGDEVLVRALVRAYPLLVNTKSILRLEPKFSHKLK